MKSHRRIAFIVGVIVALGTASSFAQTFSTGSESLSLSAALNNAVEYQDLTFGQRMRLGANFLINPDSVWDVDIGYRNNVTEANMSSFCERAREGEGLIGVVDHGRYLILVQTQDITTLCNSADRERPLVFIDPRRGDEQVISWNPTSITVDGVIE